MPRSSISSFTAALPFGLALSLGLAAAAPAAADRVVLANGRVFEDVVARVEEGSVRIQLGGGELRLATAQVASIESRPSSLEGYAERARALAAREAPAAEWLALALWARASGFEFGAREAALAAAALDPNLAELAPLLRDLGYERGPDGEWVDYDEAMRRRGWVRRDGDWLPPEVAEALAREEAAAEEGRRRQSEAARQERLAALTEMKLLAELSRPEPQPYYVEPYWGTWGVPAPIYWVPPPGQPGGRPHPAGLPAGGGAGGPAHQGGASAGGARSAPGGQPLAGRAGGG